MLALMLPFVTMSGKNKEKQNLLVWGEVQTAADGNDYLTMYKNSPAEVTAQFHFEYTDKTQSVMYDLFMPDTVAQVNDPAPVEKPVKEVVVDNIVYSTVDTEGNKYSTSDPDDPVLALLLIDMFDLYHDLFWFDVTHRAYYYHDRHYDNWSHSSSSSRYRNTPNSRRSKPSDVKMDKVDDAALIIGVATVAVASAGMIVAVADKWKVKDDRFPYFSISPQVQYFPVSGNLRNVMQMKLRVGNYGGLSFLGDFGYTAGSLNEPNLFNAGPTWSLGFGLDLGAFSLSFRGKPSSYRYSENFVTCQAAYDIFLGKKKNIAIDMSAGLGLMTHDNTLYGDIPVSLGVLWKF